MTPGVLIALGQASLQSALPKTGVTAVNAALDCRTGPAMQRRVHRWRNAASGRTLVRSK